MGTSKASAQKKRIINMTLNVNLVVYLSCHF